MKILGISGSLRKASFNTMLLRNAQALVPRDVELQIFDIADIPLYNADLDRDVKPEAVISLISQIEESAGVIFSTPEYNYSISGVLKNVLDWASRPAYASVLAHKPAGILSAAKGLAGGARAQSQLRHVLGATLTPVFPNPEYLLPQATGAFDESGLLVDQRNTKRLEKYIIGLCQWIMERRK